MLAKSPKRSTSREKYACQNAQNAEQNQKKRRVLKQHGVATKTLAAAVTCLAWDIKECPKCSTCKATECSTKFHQIRSRTLPTVIAKDAAAKLANVCSRKMGTTLTKAKNLCYGCRPLLPRGSYHAWPLCHVSAHCHGKEKKHGEHMEGKKQ